MSMHGITADSLASVSIQGLVNGFLFPCLLAACARIATIAVYLFATWMKVGD